MGGHSIKNVFVTHVNWDLPWNQPETPIFPNEWSKIKPCAVSPLYLTTYSPGFIIKGQIFFKLSVDKTYGKGVLNINLFIGSSCKIVSVYLYTYHHVSQHQLTHLRINPVSFSALNFMALSKIFCQYPAHRWLWWWKLDIQEPCRPSSR